MRESKLLLATEDGKIHIVESNGDIKFSAQNIFNQIVTPVYSLTLSEKGFLSGDKNGTIAVYHFEEKKQKGDVKDITDNFKHIRDIKVPTEGSPINMISLSPNEENIICSSQDCNIIAANFTVIQEVKVIFTE